MHPTNWITTLVFFAAATPSVAQAFLAGPPISDLVQEPFSLEFAIGDVDHDGTLDLSAVRTTAGGATVLLTLLGDGSGGFGPVATRALPPGYGSFLFLNGPQTLQDIDADGHADTIFGANPFGGTGVFFGGQGDDPARAGQISDLFAAKFADFNGDGRPDVMGRTGGFGLPERMVLALGSGNGNFGPFVGVPADPLAVLGFRPTLTGDWNGDSHLDVFLVGLGSALLLSDGTGQFTSRSNPLQPTAHPQFTTDVDGDGHLDVIGGGASWFSAMTCFVYLGDGSGNFAQGVPLAPAATLSAFVDVTGDGRPDLVGSIDGVLTVIPAAETGWFHPPILYPEHPAKILVAGDVDADGDVDLVAIPGTTGSPARVLFNAAVPPVGSTAFGTGTPTCKGTIAMVAAQPPVLGTSGFGIRCSNAPPDSLGLMLAGPRNTTGWDPLGLDLTLHLFLALPLGEIHSDAGGAARFALPLPDSPWLNGIPVHLQSIWMGDAGSGNTCSPARFELASSRGLTIRLRR